jgi:hypothetical protein
VRKILAILLITLSACNIPTRKEVNAAIWLTNGLPPDLCASVPELNDYGFYRKLNSGDFEFLSFCSPEALNFLGMHKTDFNRLMDGTLPGKVK